MTLDLVLARARLKELRALDRVRRAIIANASDPDWSYALGALDARLSELRELLAREDPELIRRCDQECETDLVTTSAPASIDRPKGSLVH